MKKIIIIMFLVLFITVVGNINIKLLQAEELKDFDYYHKEFYSEKGGCKILKEWEKQSNYKEILKLKKEEVDGSLSYIALDVVEDCLQEGNYEEYNWDVFLNNKDILMLKRIITGMKRYRGGEYTAIYYVAIYFAAYYKGWAPEDVDLLQLRETSSGCSVWDLLKRNVSNEKAEALKQRVLAQENTPPNFFDELEAETANFVKSDLLTGCDYARYEDFSEEEDGYYEESNANEDESYEDYEDESYAENQHT